MVLEFLLVLHTTAVSAGLSPEWQYGATDGMSYAAFMAVEPSKRRDVFVHLSPENRASLKKEQAERWLTAHRATLSPKQIAAVEDAIGFITPEIYRSPESPELRKRELSIKQELACTIGRRAAIEAFGWPGEGEAQQQSILGDWLNWFSDCVYKIESH